MDSSAIQRIEELVAARHMDELPTYIDSIAVPSGVEVKSLEHLQKAPSLQRVRYSTERLEDFCNYLKTEHLTERSTAVFIKADGSGAEGIIDFGTHTSPLWGHHRAELNMNHTPEFAALLQVCNQCNLDQRSLIDWLEDWQHIVVPFMGENDAISVAQAILKIQRIDIKSIDKRTSEIGDFNASRTAMESIEAKSGSDTPPCMFAVTCQVYPCTRSRDIHARLSLKSAGDKPTFRLRIVGKDALEKDVAEEVDMEIRTRLTGTDIRTYVGNVKKL